MESLMIGGVNILSQKKVTNIVVPDNELLPFLPVKEALLKMEIGSLMTWPISKAPTIKQTIVALNKEVTGSRFKYKSSKDTIIICRLPYSS